MFGKQYLIKWIRRLLPKQFSLSNERSLEDKSISNGVILSKYFFGNVNKKVNSLDTFAVSAKFTKDASLQLSINH